MIKKLFLLLIVIVFPFSLFSNTGYYYPGYGGMLYPLKSADLSMTREDISIHVYQGRELPFSRNPGNWFCYMEYDCEYYLKNSGKDQVIPIGFPIKYIIYGGNDGDPSDQLIDDCVVSVDGKEVDFRKYVHGVNPDLKEIRYDEVYGFEVPFQKGEEKQVRVKYSILCYYVNSPDLNSQVDYILKSGQTLNGPIGLANITVEFHFPVKILEIGQKPGQSIVSKAGDGSSTLLRWQLKNFTPASDLSIWFTDEEKGSVDNAEFDAAVRGLLGDPSKDLFFRLIDRFPAYFFDNENDPSSDWQKYLKISGKEKDLLAEALRTFYRETMLAADSTGLLNGLVLDSIKADKVFSPGAALVKKTADKVAERAGLAYARQLQKIRGIIKALHAHPADSVLVQKATVTANAVYYGDLMEKYDSEEFYPFSINNAFYGELQSRLSQKDMRKAKEELYSLLKKSHPLVLEQWLGRETLDINSLINFENEIDPPFGIREFYLDRIKSLTMVLKKQKKNFKAEYFLHNILKTVIRPLRYEFSLGHDMSSLINNQRLDLREAYYTLGNYHFVHDDFENAIRYYRTGLSFGSSSPLWDFLGSSIDSIMWDEYSRYDGQDDWPDISDSHPWCWDLGEKVDITEDSIVKLYTPERMLSLRLEDWKSEGETNAPAYYLAYNTSCAYSRLGQTTTALEWLKVALRLNPTLAKLVPKDKDLSLLRSEKKTELEKLFSGTR